MSEKEVRRTNLVLQIRSVWDSALELLFPVRCAGCGTTGVQLCEQCVASFLSPVRPACAICGGALYSGRLCRQCLAEPPQFRSVVSAFRFEGRLRNAIHAFKYQRRAGLAAPLAEAIQKSIQPPSVEALVLCAVPLHADREVERGYNQSALLAGYLSEHWNLPVLPARALVRIRATESQIHRDARLRWANMRGAFSADKQTVQGRPVLLIDDVCTTGATLHGCAEALMAAGAVSVDAITLARAGNTIN